jgi:ribosomal protein L13
MDAAGETLGRLATRIAVLLTGKHRADYTPVWF